MRRKSFESFDPGILKKLRKFQYWAKKDFLMKKRVALRELDSGTKLRRDMGVAHPLPPPLKVLQFRSAKTVVQCTPAGQLTGPRTIGTKEKRQKQKMFARQPLSPPKVVEITPLTGHSL